MGRIKNAFADVIGIPDTGGLPPDFVPYTPTPKDLYEMERTQSIQNLQKQVELFFPEWLFPAEHEQLCAALNLLTSKLHEETEATYA